MSISFFDVRKALRDHLGALPNAPLIITEGSGASPIVGQPYLADYLIGGYVSDRSLGLGVTELTGAYQINVCTPQAQGIFAHDALMDKLAAHFPKNKTMTRNFINLRVQKIEQSSAMAEGGFLITNASVYFQAHA